MSVIRYSHQDFRNVMHALTKLAKRNDSIKYKVIYSEAYLRKTNFINEKPEEDKIESIIQWMLDHLNKANAFAYCSQYGDAPDLSGEYPEPNKEMDLQELERKLRLIDYNLADNSGNRFIEPVYYDLFTSIINTIHKFYWDEKHDESDRY